MAIMTDDGRLQVLQTTDLVSYLNSVGGDTEIDLYTPTACLGQRAATFVLTDANGLAPWVSFIMFDGQVKGKDEQYTFDASPAVGAFISRMMDAQTERDDQPLTVYFLRSALDKFTNEVIEHEGWEAAL